MKVMERTETPKHRQVYRSLEREIRDGRFKEGDRLPSEADLVRQFGASRITVGRAVRDLQRAGLVERRAGSGTYVRTRNPAGGGPLLRALDPRPRRDGDLRADLPGNDGLASRARARARLGQPARATPGRRKSGPGSCAGNTSTARVSGVFFAPLELTPAKDEVNLRIARALDEAHIPVVLLDRTVVPYPQRGHHDLVGIDNRRAGYLVTEHLLRLGARRIAFVGVGNAAATVDARASGYREALAAVGDRLRPCARPADGSGGRGGRARSHGRGPSGRDRLRERSGRRRGVMHTLLELGHAVPGRRAPRRDRRRRIRGAAAGAPHDAAPAHPPDRRGRAGGDAGPGGGRGPADARHPAARDPGRAPVVRGAGARPGEP